MGLRALSQEPSIETPHRDRMAADGMRFTDFYVAQAVCSASRAALLTGCYPNRIGLTGALGPQSNHGIHADELTLAELVKQKGYATAIYGKWHLGHHEPFLPTRHGFDEYFGLPYSNDMWPHHPTAGDRFPDLPLLENEQVINPRVTAEDQAQLTTFGRPCGGVRDPRRTQVRLGPPRIKSNTNRSPGQHTSSPPATSKAFVFYSIRGGPRSTVWPARTLSVDRKPAL